ncbi:class A sortase [Enterococcus faecalis]|uniref:class A sortase n=1 Tax=Enterococcus faecalis TaxID=1351 RepID=UPI0019E78E18|nr:class A sortase [Enterococcus faecalis]EGO8511462.1 class A sortase [Enterococcus faecalis]EGO8546034.1 class A sortase [Enterococcus faecalis]EKL7557971.1 class A sortase [Enterococcus faecalis]EKZ0099988.1 class A sortase [Enterococcus faecalis]MCU9794434.1 class A sortase [Enterococcus faecalis]
MKHETKKWLGAGLGLALFCLLLFGGLFFTSFNQGKDTVSSVSSERKDVHTSSKKVKKKEIVSNKIDFAHFQETKNENFSDMERPTKEEIEQAQANLGKVESYAIGDLSIPAIELTMKIFQGTTYEKMLYGATTVLPDSVVGKGNYVLASHNMGVEGKMFTSLHKLKKGDDIYVSTKEGQKFHYRVITNEVVDFKDTRCLELQGKPVITLVTCDSVQATDQRVVVQGELVES